MQANRTFLNQPPEFWANVKLISQKLGYTNRKTKSIKIPTLEEIESVYNRLGLDSSKIIFKNKATRFGNLIIKYFQFRADFLSTNMEPNLLRLDQGTKIYKRN